MAGQHFGHLRADGHVRRQRGQRVLEDHGDARAADLVELLPREALQLLPIEPERALDLAIGRREAHHGEHGLALARAAFADEAEAFAGRDVEGQRLHSLDPAVRRLERNAEVPNRKN